MRKWLVEETEDIRRACREEWSMYGDGGQFRQWKIDSADKYPILKVTEVEEVYVPRTFYTDTYGLRMLRPVSPEYHWVDDWM